MSTETASAERERRAGSAGPRLGWRLGGCPDCGSRRLLGASDGYDTDFICEACGSRWHLVLGRVQRVDPLVGEGGASSA